MCEKCGKCIGSYEWDKNNGDCNECLGKQNLSVNGAESVVVCIGHEELVEIVKEQHEQIRMLWTFVKKRLD